MNKLMIGQAILFALIIIFFGFIVVREKVPRLKEKSVEEDINSYYEENYSDLEVSRDKLKYNEDDNKDTLLVNNFVIKDII